MMENVRIARLWQEFHHLSEDDKDLVLAIAETVGCLEWNTQAVTEQLASFYSHTPPQKKGEIKKR